MWIILTQAMVVIPFTLCKNIKWTLDIYEADGYYTKECYYDNKNKHISLINLSILHFFTYQFISIITREIFN